GVHEPGVGDEREADDDRGEVGHQQQPVGRGGAQQQGEHPGEGEQAKPGEQAVVGGARRGVVAALERGQARAAGDDGEAARRGGDDGDRQRRGRRGGGRGAGRGGGARQGGGGR